MSSEAMRVPNAMGSIEKFPIFQLTDPINRSIKSFFISTTFAESSLSIKMSKRVELPKKEPDGTDVDYLDEDPEVPSQKYCILSFLSPEKILKTKEMFMLEKFVRTLDFDWKMKGQEHFLAFIAKKYSLKIDDVLADHQNFEKVHRDDVMKTDIYEQYQTFLLRGEKILQEQFDNEVGFQTNVRGVKVRRSFPTVEEAQVFAQAMRRKYPKDSLYIGKVGAWLPWDPSEHLMPEVEYAEQELNEMMRKYKENEVNREIFFEEEKTQKIEKQKKENDERRKKALADAKKDAGLVETDELSDAISRPVHPTEGAIRDL
jgi:hypothetical protein